MKDELFNELVASVQEGGAILRGEAAPSRQFAATQTDVKRIRLNYRLSQSQFAGLLGISVATLQNWEQGRRMPKGAAGVLLQVAAKHPDTVWDVVKPVIARSKAKATRVSRIARAPRTNKKLKV
jgi:putative transcriptional regulator